MQCAGTPAFLSTLSLRRATGSVSGISSKTAISIHALLAESDTRETTSIKPIFGISIHALLAESDGLSYFYIIKITNFYPRSPCGERPKSDTATAFPLSFLSTLSLRRATRVSETLVPRQYQFLSTLSLRRATAQTAKNISIAGHFYPRSPCGERLSMETFCQVVSAISIHALLAESDGKSNKLAGLELVFLSTLSLRRATVGAIGQLQCIHDFYPRSPCGERRVHYDNYNLHCVISIHALLAESDNANLGRHRGNDNFYPRSPCGERPRGGGFTYHFMPNFYPRSPCGERLCAKMNIASNLEFLSTLSLRRAT